MIAFKAISLKTGLISNIKTIFIFFFLLILTSLVACHRSDSGESDGNHSPDSTQTGNPSAGVEINLQTQKLEGIRVMHPDSGTYQKHIEAYGVVLSAKGLVTLQNRYVSETQHIRKLKAHLQVSHRIYQRMDTLYHHKNTSQQDYQSARSKWISDQADLVESQQDLSSLIDSSRQVWGPVIIQWLQKNSNQFQRIIKQQTWVVRVTPASPISDSTGNLPSTVLMGITGEHMFSGRYISRSPKLDTRFQIPGYYYLVSHPLVNLNPDMNLIVELPIGKRFPAIVIPDSAVTWWKGEPWIYVQHGQDQFNRYSLAGADNTGNRWYVIAGTIPVDRNDNLVVSGTQFLLEKELQAGAPTVSAGDQDEGDND